MDKAECFFCKKTAAWTVPLKQRTRDDELFRVPLCDDCNSNRPTLFGDEIASAKEAPISEWDRLLNYVQLSVSGHEAEKVLEEIGIYMKEMGHA